MFESIRQWFVAQTEPVTFEFLTDNDAPPLEPHGGYVRIWLAEGFLVEARSWTNDHFPAMHGGAGINFDTNPRSVFSRFTRSPDVSKVAGAQLDFPLTPLLPYYGGVVDVQGALYRATVAGPLATAVSLAGTLASLVGPPLSTAAVISEKVGLGLDAVLSSTGDNPVLGLHCALEPPGGNGRILRSGHLVVVRAAQEELPGKLCIKDGLLHIEGPNSSVRMRNFDFLVLRVECRTEPEIWLSPSLRAQIEEAGVASIRGYEDQFRDLRQAAIVGAWLSKDLILRDRSRLADLVKAAIDEGSRLGFMPQDTRSYDDLTRRLLRGPDDPNLAKQGLQDLLAI